MLNVKKLLKSPKLKFLEGYLRNSRGTKFTKISISKSVFCGIFIAFLPLPFHMIIAAVLASIIGGNIFIAVSLVWVNNPLTIGPLFYISYRMGNLLLGLHSTITIHNLGPLIHFATWRTIILPILIGSVSLGAAIGVITALVTWLILYICQNFRKLQKVNE